MRKCKICGIEKELNLFESTVTKGRLYYRYDCNECRSSARRTGRPPGRPKGGIPWNKGNGESKTGSRWKLNKWVLSVKERDNYICQHCGLDDKSKMQAHHIVPWKDSVELRFELSNGLTLCRVCHTREDRRIHPEILTIRGIQRSPETRLKLSIANKGKSPPNKGKKGLQVAWNKGIPQSEETKKKLSVSVKKYYENKKGSKS